MDDLKELARAAKQRLKTDFWKERKREVDKGTTLARERGLNENKVKVSFRESVQKEISGEKSDEFYLRVKNLLDTEGDVSDAIGRLTDREYFSTLSYEEKGRYTLNLSAKYLEAKEKYKKEKDSVI